MKGRGRAPHTTECRERFRALLREDAKVKNAEARRKEFEEREADRKRRKEEKKEKKRVREEERVEEEVKRRTGGYTQVGGGEAQEHKGRKGTPKDLVMRRG